MANKVILHGPDKLLRPVVTQIMALEQIIRESQGTIYGIPEETFKENVTLKPQIQLVFAQDTKDVPEGRRATAAIYNIKVHSGIPEASWETEVKQLATKVRSEFAASSPTYTWEKGKNIYWYRDPDYGHNFKIYANSEADSQPLIKKMLDLQGQPFRLEGLTSSSPKRESENNPTGTILRFGKRRKKPRWRPRVIVRFRWATLIVPEINGDQMLVDTTGRHHDALIKA